MSAEAIAGILALLWAVLKFAEKVYDNWQARKAAEKLAVKVEQAAEKVAVKVEEVKTDAAVAKEESGKKMDEVKCEMEVVKKQTNGMLAHLEAASFTAGAQSEKKAQADKTAQEVKDKGTFGTSPP